MQIHECSVSPYGQCARRQQNLCAADHNLEKRCSAQIFQPLSQTSRRRRERGNCFSASTMEINFRDGFIEFYTPLTANPTKKHPEQNRSMHIMMDERFLRGGGVETAADDFCSLITMYRKWELR
jgi:hypothetical protein